MGDTGSTAIRDTLARALDWDDAGVRFETAVPGLLLALDAYHVGQLVAVRHALDAWR